MRETKKQEKEIKDLVRLAKRGYQGAREELVRLSEDLVYYNCLRMLKNREDARDMTQEVFLTAHEKLSSLKKEEAFFQWVKIITINKCKNALMKGNPYFFLEDLVQLDEDQSAMAVVEDRSDQGSPEKALDNKETEKVLMDLINDLPDAQRLCLVMFYYDDLSINEIAQILEVSPNTVKSRLSYARAKLKEGIEQKEREGFSLHSQQPAALVGYIAYFLKKSATPEDGRLGALIRFLRDFAASKAAGLDTAVVSAADIAIAENAALLCGAAAAKGGLGAFFGMAFWSSLVGKAVAITAAAALMIGGAFGISKLMGTNLQGSGNGLVEMSQESQTAVLHESEEASQVSDPIQKTEPRESSSSSLNESEDSLTKEESSEESQNSSESEISQTEESQESSREETSTTYYESSENTNDSSTVILEPEESSGEAGSTGETSSSEQNQEGSQGGQEQESSGQESSRQEAEATVPEEMLAQEAALFDDLVAKEAAYTQKVEEVEEAKADMQSYRAPMDAALAEAKINAEKDLAEMEAYRDQLLERSKNGENIMDALDYPESRIDYLEEIISICEDIDAWARTPWSRLFYGEYTYLDTICEEHYKRKEHVIQLQGVASWEYDEYSTAYSEWDQYCSGIKSEYPGWQNEHQAEYIIYTDDQLAFNPIYSIGGY